MEHRTFKLEIVTPFRRVYSGDVKSVIAPGFEGYFGVLARHAPYVAALRIGEIVVRGTDDARVHFASAGGFVEVLANKMTVLAEAAEEATEIDMPRAMAAKQRAEQRLSEGRQNWDLARAQIALERATTRIRVAHKAGR